MHFSPDRAPEYKFGLNAESLEQLQKKFEKERLMLLGEMHGVTENYHMYRYLCETLDVEQVMMEIPYKYFGYVKDVDLSVESDFVRILEEARKKPYVDGRVSVEFFEFLSDLQTQDIPCFFFDNSGSQARLKEEGPHKSRDFVMADFIQNGLDTNPDLKTLVIAGQYHMDYENQDSAANHLRARGIASVHGIIQYSKGEFYNYGHNDLSEGGESKQIGEDMTFVVERATPVRAIGYFE